MSGGFARGSTPTPKLHFAARSTDWLSLRLSPSIDADFKAPDSFIVKDFRGTLARGFLEGFREGYPNVHAHELDRPDLVLELASVTVWFDPVQHVNTKYVIYDLYKAHIRYHARLYDREGKVIIARAGLVESKITGSGGTFLLNSAVESMYEQIGDEMFWR